MFLLLRSVFVWVLISNNNRVSQKSLTAPLRVLDQTAVFHFIMIFFLKSLWGKFIGMPSEK